MKPRFASMWLGGCSGCHMSFLDLDELLLELLDRVELVYGPLVDAKEFPNQVDLVLVEGAVANRDNLEMLRKARANSKTLVAFGDCAVTGNVTALRNLLPVNPATQLYPQPHFDPLVPPLLDKVYPIHHYVKVDHFLPGCPPSAQRIAKVVLGLLEGGMPELSPQERSFG